MTLEGTFDGLTVLDVLGLLARAGRSGCLDLGPEGAIALARGAVCDAPRAAAVAAASLRHSGGAFRFVALAVHDDGAVGVGDFARLVERVRAEMEALSAVAPTLDCVVRLLDPPARPMVVLDAGRWALVRALAGRDATTVAGLMARLEADELDARRLLADTHAAGLVEVRPGAGVHQVHDVFDGLSGAAAAALRAVAGHDAPAGPGPAEPDGPPDGSPAADRSVAGSRAGAALPPVSSDVDRDVTGLAVA